MNPIALDPTQELETLKSENISLKNQIEWLKHQIRVLEKILFGRRSEKRSSPEILNKEGWIQTNPFEEWEELVERFQALQQAASQAGATPPPASESSTDRPVRPRARRSEFPAHLPRRRTIIEIPLEERQCPCGSTMEEIGEEVRQELERIEICEIHEIVRKKYACRHCQDQVVIPEAPPQVIDKGILGPGFLAHVITERFAHHIPYHRLEKKYESEGLSLSRSILCESAGKCADLLEPIYEQEKRETLSSDYVATDDTAVVIQDSERGPGKKGFFWVYLDPDGRIVYDFTESHSRDGPRNFLGNYRGYLQADASNVYDDFFGPGGAIEVGCFAHSRRKFEQASLSSQEFVQPALDWIGQLYRIEAEAREKGLTGDNRWEYRQEFAPPILRDLSDWLEVTKERVLEKSPVGRAVAYALRHWQALTRYLEDGRLEIDNNRSERALRPIAVGRKNWMMIGNKKAGKRAAILYSLVMTCKQIGINVAAYLRDVLLGLSQESDVKKLTPHGWKERHPDRGFRLSDSSQSH